MLEHVYADLARKEAEDERWLRSRPVCAWCGEPIQDEYCYEIDGDLICERCIEDCRTSVPEGWNE